MYTCIGNMSYAGQLLNYGVLLEKNHPIITVINGRSIVAFPDNQLWHCSQLPLTSNYCKHRNVHVEFIRLHFYVKNNFIIFCEL